MKFNELSPEMQEQIRKAFPQELLEKAEKCESIEEIMDMIDKENLELTKEQLELVAGGCWGSGHRC